MAKKMFKFDQEARDSLAAGVAVLARCVVTTLGPKGRNVALDKKWNAPHVIHDGVTVANDIELSDPFENMGAQLVKEAASKTNDKAGDGTTTATLLADEIVYRGMEELKNGANPMDLQKGINQAVELIVDELKKIAKPVDTSDQITQVATISAASEEIGKLIAEAMEKVGKEGVIAVDESAEMTTKVEHKGGMEFDKGYISPQFCTDTDKMEAEILDPFILLTDQPLNAPEELVKVFEKVVQQGQSKDVVLIAESFSDPVITTLLINKARGGLNPLAIQALGIGAKRKEMLEDMAILTGAQVITKEVGLDLEKVTIDMLGRSERVVSDKDKTQIIGGKGLQTEVDKRVTQIKALINKESSEFEKKTLKDRIARLTTGVAVIKVGAQTEVELKEKKERVIDAVEATKAAVAEGIIAGGGVALAVIGRQMVECQNANRDYKLGYNLTREALSAPLIRILENAGVDVTKISQEIMDNDSSTFGYDIESEKFGDLFDLGVVDPVKVTRMALQNAASVAGMILTTNVLVTDEPEKEKKE